MEAMDNGGLLVAQKKVHRWLVSPKLGEEEASNPSNPVIRSQFPGYDFYFSFNALNASW